ncbi:GDP-mannose 4,6-dehydratase [candidate division WOR-1 bacterium RIFOXYA12_FULL_43_27]|uniref:GDP-mannose 4,6-dehydratase n=1 Tax=candidate division WOR-1 bacterium RIFOXYC2_FULL_46_14 TaxID=1802587 RepID=A0A1F4U3D1_UNCSA|nr:MAG: GDP-mannose 4,6-dehydratase [candidate division WOR-1 bacterium RIFOXYA12_FULL_43_27]OGC20190.1 MAG: GDP-mannose 4,6-dehydratase [candidate division WOR-1 bacterium RIFOXYB2_FULL_46_45]OGC32072.1 MAG: GDP-mannose 4,6-dehydratase [candidate division WOR-1 bacterium RIFOXYA2_FULL_46_56]OGC39474.1 MAG: GDP-mannose 4,6-dehydratase [candidate division WOR-1 bacterium RIFOXYC2_FULL_46_14]
MKRALVLGVTGQDGSYLAEILLEKGYEVHGMIRRSATGNTRNIDHLIEDPKIFGKNFFLQRGDLADPTSLYRIINAVRPQEIYNEADQDHVSWSYDMVGYSADITGAAVGRILEIIRQIDRTIRYFQPCTSNMFGLTDSIKQNENTPFNPQSPYACAKAMAFYLTRYYRQAFGIFASTAILYNHESPRRTPEYLTRKVTRAVAKIACGKQDKLILGDMSACIDWGYAREYMETAWRILQLDKPDDFVIATGEAHSVGEWVEKAFAVVNLKPDNYVVTDQKLLRPTKTSSLVGDITKARKTFGFDPKFKIDKLVKLMVEADLEKNAE